MTMIDTMIDGVKMDNATAAPRVALVEADEMVRTRLRDGLAEKGYAVTALACSREALALAAGGAADVVLLDWDLPGTDGASVLREARERGIDTPIVGITAAANANAEERALASGAVDFVHKARGVAILAQRTALAVGGAKCGPEPVTLDLETPRILGDLDLREDQGRACWKGAQIPLTLTEYRIVAMLASAPDRDFSYREIYDIVHGKNFMAGYGDQGFRANVRAFIKRIRRKFRDSDSSFDCIGNYPGFGYRWAARDGAGE